MLTPQQYAEKWAKGIQDMSATAKASIDAMTVNPMEQAAQAEDKWAAGVQKAFQENKFSAGLRSAGTLADWKKAYLEKGVPNAQNGAKLGKRKVERIAATLIPHQQMVKDAIAAMPNNTEADAEQRALAAIRLMRQYKKPL